MSFLSRAFDAAPFSRRGRRRDTLKYKPRIYFMGGAWWVTNGLDDWCSFGGHSSLRDLISNREALWRKLERASRSCWLVFDEMT